MAVKTDKPLFVRLPPDLRVDLDAFCEAHYDATAVRVVCDALRQFIDRQIEVEPALRARYVEARTRISGRPAEAIRLVNPKKKPG